MPPRRGRGYFSRIDEGREFVIDADSDDHIGDWYRFLYTNFAGQRVRIATGGADGRLYEQGVYDLPSNVHEFNVVFGRNDTGGMMDLIFVDSDITLVHGRDTRAVVYPGRKIASRRLENQRWRAGELNCVLAPILKTLKEKHAKFNEKMPGPTASNYKAKLKKLKEHAVRLLKCDEYMVKAMDEGVGEEFLTEICQELNVDVTITAALQGKDGGVMSIFHRSSTKSVNDRLRFNFINGQLNHVEVLPSFQEYRKLSYYPMDNAEMLSPEAMVAKRAELLATKSIYRYQCAHGDITAIATPTQLYRLTDEFSVVRSAFMKETTLDVGMLCMINDREVSDFIKRGVHGNGTVDYCRGASIRYMEQSPDFYVTQLEELKNARARSKSVDMKRAYTQGRRCDQYVGYPHKITDFRATDKLEGVGYYFVKSFNWTIAQQKHSRFYEIESVFLQCFRDMDVYASPLLMYLQTLEVKMEIVYGAWGTSIDFDFNEHPEMMEKYRGTMSDDGVVSGGQRGYALGVGMMQCTRPTTVWYLDVQEEDIPLFEQYQFQHDLNCPSMHFYKDGKLGATYEKKTVFHSLHVAGFITAYVQLNMMKMLLNCNVPVDKMLRVCSDGAYFDVPDISDITFDSTLFAEKEVKIDPTGASGSFSNGCSDTYTGQMGGANSADFFQRLQENDPLLCTIPRAHHQFSAVVGAGGCAKSAVTIRDMFVEGGCVQKFGEVGNGGLVRSLFLTPSHKLRMDKQLEYGHLSTLCVQALLGGRHETLQFAYSRNVWIIDECSMLLKVTQLSIMAMAEKCGVKVIFLGDPGYQAAPVPLILKDGSRSTEEFDLSYFTEGVNLQTLTRNYRFKCNILVALCSELRRLIAQKAPAHVGHRFVLDFPSVEYVAPSTASYFGQLNFPKLQRVDLDELKTKYMLGDWILTRTHVIGETYTALFPDLERYQVLANSNGHYNGSIVFTSPGDKVPHKRTHANTMHAVQGITVKRPYQLFIDMSRPIELRVLYTALSRPERYSQIFLVVDERLTAATKKPRLDEGPASCDVDAMDDECFF